MILTGFLYAFLEEALEVSINCLKLEGRLLHKAYEEDKLSILDLLANLDNETQVNLEIPLRNAYDMLKQYILEWVLYVQNARRDAVLFASENHYH